MYSIGELKTDNALTIIQQWISGKHRKFNSVDITVNGLDAVNPGITIAAMFLNNQEPGPYHTTKFTIIVSGSRPNYDEEEILFKRIPMKAESLAKASK